MGSNCSVEETENEEELQKTAKLEKIMKMGLITCNG